MNKYPYSGIYGQRDKAGRWRVITSLDTIPGTVVLEYAPPARLAALAREWARVLKTPKTRTRNHIVKNEKVNCAFSGVFPVWYTTSCMPKLGTANALYNTSREDCGDRPGGFRDEEEKMKANRIANVMYDYMPVDGDSHYADTKATINGKDYAINTQYGVIAPWRHLSNDCDMMQRMGGKCTCGAMDGVDVAAVLADARINGKFGLPPRPVETAEHKAQRLADLAKLDKHGPGWCDMCKSYCYGDCEA